MASPLQPIERRRTYDVNHEQLAPVDQELTGGPGSPGLPGGPSVPCQKQTRGILKHVCENGNVYQAQLCSNVTQ